MALMHHLEVISQDDCSDIHAASLKILEHTGVEFRHPEALQILERNGARIDGHVAYFPEKLVEEAIRKVPPTFEWTARNDRRSVTVGQGVLLQPIAGTVFIQDLDGGRRPGTLNDIANLQKIFQALDPIDLVGMIACEPRDVPPENVHLHLMQAILRNTDKPVNGFVTVGKHAKGQLDMMEIAMGGPSVMDRHHCIAVSISAISPLHYTHDAIETLLAYVRRNQIPTILSAPIAGATSPLSLMGTTVQQNAEILAGIVLTQLVRPGNPVVYSPSATTVNMLSGGFSTGAPENMLINAANFQMARDYYHFPMRGMPASTESKTLDYQAGYESMQNLMMAMLGGAHILNEAVGVLDNLMTSSYEKTILDCELVGRVKRICAGIDGPDRNLSPDAIQSVGRGGTFLTHADTYEHCRRRWQPTAAFWGSHDDWQASGSPDIVVEASRRYKQILKNSPPVLIDPHLDRELAAYVQKASH